MGSFPSPVRTSAEPAWRVPEKLRSARRYCGFSYNSSRSQSLLVKVALPRSVSRVVLARAARRSVPRTRRVAVRGRRAPRTVWQLCGSRRFRILPVWAIASSSAFPSLAQLKTPLTATRFLVLSIYCQAIGARPASSSPGYGRKGDHHGADHRRPHGRGRKAPREHRRLLPVRTVRDRHLTRRRGIPIRSPRHVRRECSR